MLFEARRSPEGRGDGSRRWREYRPLFIVCDEPLFQSDDLRLRTGAGCL